MTVTLAPAAPRRRRALPERPTKRRVLRPADVVCTSCQDAFLIHGWPIDLSPYDNDECEIAELFDCPSCLDAIAARLEPWGALVPFYRQRCDRVRHNAVHEAGHAEVARALGATVGEVEIPRTRAGRPKPIIGGSTYVNDLERLTGIDVATIRWAGQRAELSWLALRERNTRADRLDVRLCGAQDLIKAGKAIHESDPTADIDAQLPLAEVRAAELVRERWEAIVDLADRLVLHGVVHLDTPDHATTVPAEPVRRRAYATRRAADSPSPRRP